MNANVATIILGVVGLLSLVGGSFMFFYKRGGDERELVVALHANTGVTKELSTDLRSFKEHTVNKLHTLEMEQQRLGYQVESHAEKLARVGKELTA